MQRFSELTFGARGSFKFAMAKVEKSRSCGDLLAKEERGTKLSRSLALFRDLL